MVKIKTSKKLKRSLEDLSKNPHSGIKRSNSREYLLNEDNIGRGILECLNNNDPDGVIEIIYMYLHALNKSRFVQQSEVPRSTIYTALKSKNPTLKTLAKLMHATHQIAIAA